MRKCTAFISLFLLVILGLSNVVAAAPTDNFTIQSFSADYYLSRNNQKTSQLEVKETIVAEFPSYDQNRGILRAIPKKYQKHSVGLEIKSVTDQSGKAYPYTTSSQNDNTVLKIGDANKYVHGLVTYNINYVMRNVISYQQLDEFYWDINGDQWPQTMETVTARIHLPFDIADSLSKDQSCYAGPKGSKQQNCTVSQSRSSNETVITSTATNLRGYETLTTVIGFTKGTFQQGPEVAAEKRNQLLTLIALIITTAVFPLITLVICFRKWWQQGRDPEGKGVIVPEYVAPKNLNVVSSAYILEMSLPSKAISAGIIELAIQGILRIHEIEKKKFIGKSTEYEIEVAKEPQGVSQEQMLILEALFEGAILPGSRTTINQQKNKLFSTVTKIGDHLSTRLTSDGYFSSDPSKAKKRFLGVGGGLLVAGILLFIVFPLGLGLLASAVIAFIFSSIMPARSAQGVESRDYLLGLKHYIEMAEADRIAYLQSPQGAEKRQIDPNSPKQQIKLFEELLPYAMLFGLEKDWAHQFKDMYKEPPTWYSGNMNTFNSMYLANSLSQFNSASATAFSAPSSSSSSGMGGGGFSGGGGGGGGGGGW